MKINQLKLGSLLSYVQIILSTIVGLVQSPIIIRTLGQSEYGIYNTVASTLSMLSILSLGFNSSYVRYYARYKKDDDKVGIYRLNGLFLIIFSIIGIIAFVCGMFLTFNLEFVFSDGLTAAEYNIAQVLMFVLSVNVAFTFPMSVFQNIISANERFVFLKFLGIVKTIISPVFIIIVLFMGQRSVALAVVTVLVNISVDLIHLFYVLFVIRDKFYFNKFEKGLFKSLFAFTLFLAINLIVDEINSNMDKFLLARYNGTVSVAVYSVGYTLYNYYRLFSTSVSSVFAPKIHKLYNDNKEDEHKLTGVMTDIFVRVGRIQFIILALVVSGFVFFGRRFIAIWAGAGYEDSYVVALMLMLPATIPLIQNVGIEIQRAENKHKFRSISYLCMAIVNLVLTIILCSRYGAIGAALGTAVSFVLANGIIMNIYYHKACHINIISFWKQILRFTPALILPIVFGILVVNFINLENIWYFLASMTVYVIIYCVSMWLLGMNSYERELIKAPIRSILLKR